MPIHNLLNAMIINYNEHVSDQRKQVGKVWETYMNFACKVKHITTGTYGKFPNDDVENQ